MGLKVKGGMWCDFCQRPVAGQKSTKKFLKLAGMVASGGMYAPTRGTSIAQPAGARFGRSIKPRPRKPVGTRQVCGPLVVPLPGHRRSPVLPAAT